MRTLERVLLATVAVAGLVTTSVLTSTTAAAATITVSTSAQLTQALANVQPGDTVQLAANTTFKGTFKAPKSGTSAKRITLTGPRSAVIDGTGGGRTLELTGSYWTITGFRITGGQKGLMALGVHDTEVRSLKVDAIGHEAIHFQYTSTDNVVRDSEISNTGLEYAGYGEGVYFGSANSNWPNGQVDRSDRNRALNNKFGPNVRAEAIDIKEGTTGGELSGNTFDGTGMAGEHSADSWVDVKGNNYKISGNTGHKIFVASSNHGGYEVHQQLSGWGMNNTFSANTSDPQSQYAWGFYAQSANGNKFCASNKVSNAGKGFSNIGTTSGC
jgi:uncharacterized Zn ribbon protein